MFMKKDEKGFTLIELMIVIAIIGILAAIAIPQFNAYRARSYNASANADMRNLQTSMEGYYVDFEIYPTCADTAEVISTLGGYGFTKSSGVVIGAVAGTDSDYTVDDSYNSKAGDKAITYTIDTSLSTEIGKIPPP